MIYSFYPIADNTLYESAPTRNAGNDAILDLSKLVNGNTVVNNRALVKFDSTHISDLLNENNISFINDNVKFYLNLFSATDVTKATAIAVHPVASSWEEGYGKFFDNPITQNGSSWVYTAKVGTNTVLWNTSSPGFGEVAWWSTTEGGGVWKDSPAATTQVDNLNPDIRVDVTSIVQSWILQDPNYGFMIKKSQLEEESLLTQVSLKYFSKDTNTIYLPRLDMMWEDALCQPGNLQQPDFNKQLTVYPKNLKKDYKQASKTRINVGVREKYPTITFSTQSNYLETKYIPTSSFFYSIAHADTNETVIPFDTDYTKVSCDSSGNYINLWIEGLQVERYYKLMFRIDHNGSEDYIDNHFIFKVTK